MRSVYYNNLGANKRTYDEALKCFQNRGRSFTVISPTQAAELISMVLMDHPEIFYVSSRVQMIAVLLRISATPTYLYSSAETEQIRRQLESKAREILTELINDHQSDYDKVRVLHDYLKNHIEYDSEAASGGIFGDKVVSEAHTIVGALLKNKCVCEGFAKALKFLCDKIGLECWVVTGNASSPLSTGLHAWNIVKINGYYHHIDVTWDNQYADSAAVPNYGYMNLSDEEIAKDHTWNRKNYPQCPDSPYNYFRVNNALLDSKAQLESMLYNSLQMEEEFILFRVVRGSILEREINGCIEECVMRAAKRCKHILVANFHCRAIPEQLTFCVQPEYRYR